MFKNGLVKLVIILNLILYSSLDAFAQKEILFEGFFKVLINKQHIGYSITRYEYDAKTKNFYCTVFTRTGALGGNIIESIKAASDLNLDPLNYEYATLITEQQKTISKKIEAKFVFVKDKKKSKSINSKKNAKITKNENEEKESKTLKIIANVFQDGKLTKIENELPNKTFLSYFLIYKLLKSDVGIQTGTKYNYKAIAEEKASVDEKAEAIVTTQEEINGINTYKVENKFDQQPFVSFVTEKGELIKVINPSTGVDAILVAKPNEAVADFPFPTKTLKELFGEVPLGTANIVSKRMKEEALRPITEPPADKKFGAPAGIGIQTKPSNSEIKQEKIEKVIPKTDKELITPKEKI